MRPRPFAPTWLELEAAGVCECGREVARCHPPKPLPWGHGRPCDRPAHSVSATGETRDVSKLHRSRESIERSTAAMYANYRALGRRPTPRRALPRGCTVSPRAAGGVPRVSGPSVPPAARPDEA